MTPKRVYRRFTWADVTLVREWAAWLARGIPYEGISHPPDEEAARRAEELADQIAMRADETRPRTYRFELSPEPDSPSPASPLPERDRHA